MTPRAATIRAEAERLTAALTARGAVPFETGILQPAGPLLDLYGEDIRARAFTTRAPQGEAMLRPDFTLPLVRHHMADGASPARYVYAGEVFRRQEAADRPAEYVQVGYEVFADDDPAARDAEVLATLRGACEGRGDAIYGDLGLVTAAVAGLTTSARRRAMLLRHVWRPERFRALLRRYAGPAQAPEPVASDAPAQGDRAPEDVAARLDALRADAATPPLPPEEAEALLNLLGLACPAERARAALDPLAPALGGLAARLPAFEARQAAFAGVTGLATLTFEATHARSAMEYYDGFTFSIRAGQGPPLATGGRYDALTRAVSGGAGMAAVGGVVRPDALIGARG